MNNELAMSGLDVLDRYVLPVDEPVPLDVDGFFEVERLDYWWHTGPKPTPVTDLLEHSASFVLLSPGGVGKTSVLDALRDREPDAQEVVLKTRDLAGKRELLDEALLGTDPVYLDGLDEAALTDASLFQVLDEYFRRPAARDVPWRLACRPDAWNPAFEETLRQHLGEFERWRLLPLTKDAARRLIQDLGGDDDAFINQLCSARLGRLAATPGHLRSVARQWLTTGSLPASQLEAMEYEVQGLLDETNSHRQPTLASDLRLSIARRLAGLSIFCGIPAFSLNPSSADVTAMRETNLPSRPEPDDVAAPIQLDTYREVLGTALFDATGASGTVAFRHQQYAEYLAARYLVDRGINRIKVPTLLGVTVDGELPGPMVGVASWLGALQRDLVAELVEANAFGFARSGVGLPSEDSRAAVVRGLLDAAARGELDPQWGLDLTPVVYPGLGGALLSRLGRGVERQEEMWWIAHLAITGACRATLPHLTTIALAHTVTPPARRYATRAVLALGSNEELERLKPLLTLDDEHDPNDEILGEVLDGLYPRALPSSEMLAALRPQRRRNLVGLYQRFLGTVADRMTTDDLVESLHWAASAISADEGAYGRLVPRLLETAWRAFDDPGVRDALVDLVAAAADCDAWTGWLLRREFPWLAGPDKQRRDLVLAVAARIEGDGWHNLLDLRLVDSGDALWLLELLSDQQPNGHEYLARCVPHLLSSDPSAELADAVLTLSPEHPAFNLTRWTREPQPVDGEAAERWRRRRELEAQRNEDELSEDEIVQGLREAIRKAQDDPGVWWKVPLWLALAPDGRDSLVEQLSHDLTRRPAWTYLIPEERVLVMDLGRVFLHEHALQPDGWFGKQGSVEDEAVADWAGVYLLTTLARHDKDTLPALPAETWQRWARAIVGAWTYDSDEDANLRCVLVDKAPESGRAAIAQAALDLLDALDPEAGYLPYASLGVLQRLARDIGPEVGRRLQERRYKGALGGDLVYLLVKHAPQTALPVCRALRHSQDAALARAAKRSLAELDPAATVDDLVAADHTDDELTSLVPALEVTALDTDRLADLAKLLLDRFPYDDDPPMSSRSVADGGPEDTRRVRDLALRLLAERGQTGILRHLAAGRSERVRDVLARHARAASSNAATVALKYPTPDQLLELLDRGDARLVRTSRDLTDVAVEVLRQLDDDLRHGTMFQEVWAGEQLRTEDDISDWLQRRFAERLIPRIVADREVQVQRRKAQGIGTRMDLFITAAPTNPSVPLVHLVIEAKRVTHPQLMTSLNSQLVDQYLLPKGLTHGIYLVYWVPPSQRAAGQRKKHEHRQALLEELQRQAAALPEGVVVTPFVLDLSKPA